MSCLVTVLRQLWGLFIDDGSLAFALVLWCFSAGFILPRLIPFSGSNAPILFVGCVAILVANIALTVRNHRSRG